jgi:hypothetical protein
VDFRRWRRRRRRPLREGDLGDTFATESDNDGPAIEAHGRVVEVEENDAVALQATARDIRVVRATTN